MITWSKDVATTYKTLPFPIVFTGLANVTACVPHNFTFAYNTSDPFILNPAFVTNLTAWVEPVAYEGLTPPEYILASQMALNDTATAIPWTGGIPADTYALKAEVNTSAPGVTYELIDVRFVITATANTSCGASSQIPEYPHSTGLPAEDAANPRKFGGGAIAGIVVGVLISLLICAAGLFFIRIRRGMRKAVQEPPAYQHGGGFPAEQREYSGGIDHEVSLPKFSEKAIEAGMDFEAASTHSVPPSYKEHNV